MKKVVIILACVITINSYAQEQQQVFIEDTIIQTSKPFGLSENWDFSNIIFSNYHDTNDSDLVRLKDPMSIYINHNFVNFGDSSIGILPQRTFTQQNIILVRTGSYTAIYEGHGTVKIPGQTFNNAEKIKIIERYSYKFNGDSIPVARYNNVYYTFFNKSTHNHVISVFKKSRVLMGKNGGDVIGIGYSMLNPNNNGGNNNFTQANIQMNLNPNPANNNTSLNYNLVTNAQVLIEITNQSGTVSSVVFNGSKQAGSNQKTIPLNQYQSGLYTVKLTVNGTVFSQPLIIQ